MRTDAQIQKDVMDQLRWDPFVDASQIGVAVQNGVVTLSGQVDSYAQKKEAENTAKSVQGVKAIAENIQITVSPAFGNSDAAIAEAVLLALKWNSAVPDEGIRVKVENGNVTLEGQVDWDYQRRAAASAIENLEGVRLIFNDIGIRPTVTPTDIKHKIGAAFQRTASMDANQISVEVIGSKAILRGKVRSYLEKELANNAAYFAPGITSVEDHLEIVYENADTLTF